MNIVTVANRLPVRMGEDGSAAIAFEGGPNGRTVTPRDLPRARAQNWTDASGLFRSLPRCNFM